MQSGRFAAGFRSCARAPAGRVSPARAEGCQAPQATDGFVPREQPGSATPWLAQGTLSLRLGELRRASWWCPLMGGECPGPPAPHPAHRTASYSLPQLHPWALAPQVTRCLLGPSLASSQPPPGQRALGRPAPRHSQGLDVALGELGSPPGRLLPPWGLRTFSVMGFVFFSSRKLSNRVTDQLAHSPLSHITQALLIQVKLYCSGFT